MESIFFCAYREWLVRWKHPPMAAEFLQCLARCSSSDSRGGITGSHRELVAGSIPAAGTTLPHGPAGVSSIGLRWMLGGGTMGG